MPAIGFIGTNLHDVAKLYQDFVAFRTESGIQKDQDHPPAIVLGIKAKNIRELRDNFKLIKELGATQVIVTSDDLSPEDKEKIQRNFNRKKIQIISIPPKTSLKTPKTSPLKNEILIKQETYYENYGKKKQEKFEAITAIFENNRNNFDDTHGGFKPTRQTMSTNRQTSTRNERLKGIAKRLKSKQVVGVIGGAGVMTGADFCKELAKRNTSFLMFSDTTAPDKNNATDPNNTKEVVSFVPSYNRNVRTLIKFTKKIAIPCNTAHILLPEFCEDHLKNEEGQYGKLVNIGQSTIKFIRKNHPKARRVILLGTPATVTHPNSAYKDSTINPEGTKEEDRIVLITPNEDQLFQIYLAIYESKGYRTQKIIEAHKRGEDISKYPIPNNITYKDLLKTAKDRVNNVIKEMRKSHGNIPVILGCTELPLLFDSHQLLLNELISSTGALAEGCFEILQQETYSPPLNVKEGNNHNISDLDLSESKKFIRSESEETDYSSGSQNYLTFDQKIGKEAETGVVLSLGKELNLFDAQTPEKDCTDPLSGLECDMTLSQELQKEEQREREEKFEKTFNQLSKKYDISYNESNKTRIIFTKKDITKDDQHQTKKRKTYEVIIKDKKDQREDQRTFFRQTKIICEYFNLSDQEYRIHPTEKYVSINNLNQENVEKIKEWLENNEDITQTNTQKIPTQRQILR